MKALLAAARNGDEAALRAALAGGADVNGVPPGSDSPLCYAAMFRHPECSRLLVEAGADVNHRGSYGRTPLHYAALHDLAITGYLLDHGADMRARNDGDEDVLEDLITHDDADVRIARLLIERGFDLSMRPSRYHPGRPHLAWAAFCGRVEIVDLLIRSGGVDVNERGSATFSELCGSCRPEGQRAILALLVKGGLDPNTSASWHGTVLMKAARFGDLELVRELLARGADPNLAESGATPLSCAAEGRDPRVARLLRKHGARARSDERAKAAKDRRLAKAHRLALDAPENLDVPVGVLVQPCHAFESHVLIPGSCSRTMTGHFRSRALPSSEMLINPAKGPFGEGLAGGMASDVEKLERLRPGFSQAMLASIGYSAGAISGEPFINTLHRFVRAKGAARRDARDEAAATAARLGLGVASSRHVNDWNDARRGEKVGGVVTYTVAQVSLDQRFPDAPDRPITAEEYKAAVDRAGAGAAEARNDIERMRDENFSQQIILAQAIGGDSASPAADRLEGATGNVTQSFPVAIDMKKVQKFAKENPWTVVGGALSVFVVICGIAKLCTRDP